MHDVSDEFYLKCCLIEESDELSGEENNHLLPQKLYRERERALLDLRHFKAAKTGLNGDIYYAHTHKRTLQS